MVRSGRNVYALLGELRRTLNFKWACQGRRARKIKGNKEVTEMIKTIKNQFATFAAHNTKTENPDNRCLDIQGGGTG